MKIAVITPLSPIQTNEKGPTALLYSLLVRRPPDWEIDLFYVNHGNFSSKVLDSVISSINPRNVQLVKKLRGGKWMIRTLKTLLSGLPYECALHSWEDVKLKDQKYDFVLIYTFWPMKWLSLTEAQVVLLGPDCASLHHRETQKYHPEMITKLKSFFRQHQFEILERLASKNAKKIFFVGRRDKVNFDKVTRTDKSFFLLHPLSEDMQIYQSMPNGIFEDAFSVNYNNSRATT